MANLAGKNLGKYRVVARLGRGGMAEVYKAYQPGLDRYVSIKVLHSHLLDDEDFIGRFEREALATGKLRHPNIVQAVDFDREGEIHFMAMEFIDGPTLKNEMKTRRIEGKPFSLEEVARIFTALCSAIDYAHRRNMIHRDIKPANVMINQEGQVVLTDFGIAKIMGGTQYTRTGSLSGTPAYMSPEQGQGERADERSDIYALGVMLYEMVTGVVPYEADTPYAVIMKHITQPLPLPTKVNPSIPENVERVILKAMSKDPVDRYQTAGELASALREAVGLSPDDNLQKHPLVTVASPPVVEEVEYSTDRLTARQKTKANSGDGVTVWSRNSGSTTVTPAGKNRFLFPLLAGGGVIIVVLLTIIGFLILPESISEATPDVSATDAFVASISTSTAEAEQNTARAEALAATAAFLAPTETAEVQIAQETHAAATRTAQALESASLVQNILATAQAATAEAATARTVEAEAATAEALANATLTLTPTPTPTSAPTEAPTSTSTFTPVPIVEVPPTPTDTPTPAATPTLAATPTSEAPPLSGKLAFPVDNGAGKYNVHIVSMPEGNTVAVVPGARQPNFRLDGVKLLVNGEGGDFGENIFEANPAGVVEKPVSGSPSDLFPFYKPDGTTLVYSNPQLVYGSVGYQSYLFVQCALKPPSQESDKCAAIADFGLIIPPGAIGDIIGSHPVWTTSDLLAYKGCNSWAGGGSCGIYTVGSWAVKRTSNGELPRKILDGTSLTPTDAKAGLIAYQSRESGDWEAFVVSDNGAGAVNLSNSPSSRDGLGTISPDGKWLAFASDRSGGWAVYVVPTSGGQVQKLFDFPKANPWGTGDREWINERMSWAP